MANYNSLAEFGAALQRAYDGLGGVVATSLNTRTKSLTDAIRLRVSGSGEKADGGKFSTPYSRSHSYKRGKYGQGALGKQTAHKGFYYQGTMWDNFKLLMVRNNKDVVTATIGFTGNNLYKSNAELDVIHSDNEGTNIGMANNTEIEDFTELIATDIYNHLARTL